MSIKSVCRTNVTIIEKDSTLRDVANLMQRDHVGCVIVTEGFNGKKVPCGCS